MNRWDDDRIKNGIDLCSKQRPVGFGSQVLSVPVAVVFFFLSGTVFPAWTIALATVATAYLVFSVLWVCLVYDKQDDCRYRKFPCSEDDIRHNKALYYNSMIENEKYKISKCEMLKEKFDPSKEEHFIDMLDIEIMGCREQTKQYKLSLENIENEERDSTFLQLTGMTSKHNV